MSSLAALSVLDLMGAFEREYRTYRIDKEPKSLWSRDIIYQNSETNDLFLAYRRGYSFAKAVYSRTPESSDEHG